MKQLIRRTINKGRVAVHNSLYRENKDNYGTMVFDTATRYELVLELHAEFALDDNLPSECREEARKIACKRIARELYKELFPLVDDIRLALFASDIDKAMDALLKIESTIKDPPFIGVGYEYAR